MFCLIAGGAAAVFLADKSMKMGLIMYALPVAVGEIIGVFVAAIVWLSGGANSARQGAGGDRWPGRVAILAASLLAWGYFTLIRVDGITGNLVAERSWRWDATQKWFFGRTKGASCGPGSRGRRVGGVGGRLAAVSRTAARQPFAGM